jgi:hypothetical protein
MEERERYYYFILSWPPNQTACYHVRDNNLQFKPSVREERRKKGIIAVDEKQNKTNT